MRTPILILALVAAAPAGAQPATQFELDALRAQQEAAQRRAIDQSNQFMALENRLRTEQAVQDQQAARAGQPLPELRYDPSPGLAPAAKTPAYPSTPDAALADSNRRVQDAVERRRTQEPD